MKVITSIPEGEAVFCEFRDEVAPQFAHLADLPDEVRELLQYCDSFARRRHRIGQEERVYCREHSTAVLRQENEWYARVAARLARQVQDDELLATARQAAESGRYNARVRRAVDNIYRGMGWRHPWRGAS